MVLQLLALSTKATDSCQWQCPLKATTSLEINQRWLAKATWQCHLSMVVQLQAKLSPRCLKMAATSMLSRSTPNTWAIRYHRALAIFFLLVSWLLLEWTTSLNRWLSQPIFNKKPLTKDMTISRNYINKQLRDAKTLQQLLTPLPQTKTRGRPQLRVNSRGRPSSSFWIFWSKLNLVRHPLSLMGWSVTRKKLSTRPHSA